jgi:hypothetical protein
MPGPKPWRNRFVGRLVTAVSVPAAERPFMRKFPYEVVDQPRRKPPEIRLKTPQEEVPPTGMSPEAAVDHWRWIGGLRWRSRRR